MSSLQDTENNVQTLDEPQPGTHSSSRPNVTVPQGHCRASQTPFSPFVQVPNPTSTKGFFDYELPNTVASARDGWQWTSQSGAVVSGLLAAVAAQLLGMFKEDDDIGPGGAKGFLVATCYVAIFLNINATIGSFVLVDCLGEVGYEAAKREAANHLAHLVNVGQRHDRVSTVLKEFGVSKMWTVMLVHWLCTFYLGILTLIISLLTYVMLAEPLAIKVVMGVTVGLTLLPTTYFIFFREFGKKQEVSRHSCAKNDEEK